MKNLPNKLHFESQNTRKFMHFLRKMLIFGRFKTNFKFLQLDLYQNKEFFMIDYALKKIQELEKRLEKYYQHLLITSELDLILKGTYILEADIDNVLNGTY